MKLWQSTAKKIGRENRMWNRVVSPERGDRRFKDKDWEENQVFDYIKQSYLLSSKWLENLVEENPNAQSHEGQKLNSMPGSSSMPCRRQNFAMTNPEVIRETIEKNGKNLLNGLENIA